MCQELYLCVCVCMYIYTHTHIYHWPTTLSKTYLFILLSQQYTITVCITYILFVYYK